jgi:hypothetical protein
MFGNYVSPSLVNRMLDAPNMPEKSEPTQAEFIWLWLNDCDDGYEDRLTRVLDLGLKFEAFEESISPPVVIFWFGIFPHMKSACGAKNDLVEELRKELGNSAKLYHGSATAKTGNIGSSGRFSFGVLTGRRSVLLTDLAALDFGQYKKYENHGG